MTFRKRAARVANRLGTWLALVGLVVLVVWASYPLWDGYGSWGALPAGPAPISQTLDDERFTEAAQQALAAITAHRERHGFPALTAAVSFGGQLVWTGAVGWADLDNEIAASRATVLRIGSTSKAVTATALARLIDAGEMALDEPLSEYADDWPNPTWSDLTPRQLASHTAGLPDYKRNGDLRGSLVTLFGRRHYSSVRESLGIFDGSDLLFEPGSEFSYTSFDVNLLGAAIASSQSEPFLDVLDRLVFEPLDLTASGGAEDGTDRPDLARFYEINGNRARTWRPFDLSQRWPGGGLVSTSADLARIGGSWLDPDFISVETRRAMWTPQILRNGDVNEQRYAVGWRFYSDETWPGDDDRPLPFAHHGGVSKGAMSWLVVYPSQHLSIAVNINTRAETFGDFRSIEREIAALFLERIEQLVGN